MVYGYDQALHLPTVDLYDTLLMAMALNAAKDMYDKGELQIKDFLKAYGDFMTPITADQDWYNQNVTGKVRDVINNIYARGGDPLRNALDRAQISMLINSIPYGEIAKLKNSAENAKEYLKNRAALESQGKYSGDLEERFLGYDISNWDTMRDGAWNRVSPTEMKTLKELTEQLYNSRTARDLTEADLKTAGIPYDPRYQYSGYLDSDILNTAKGFTPGWNDSIYSEYYRDLAKKQLLLSGVDNPTAAQIEATLQRNIADANQEWLINPTKKADEFALDDYRTANDIKAHKAKAAVDHYYKSLENNDPSNGSGNRSQGGYNIPEDVFLTSIAKAAGMEYLPAGGVTPNMLTEMSKSAVRRQNIAVKSTGDVLSATGMFISPEKVASLIPSDGKNGRGYFLNSSYFKNLHNLEDVRTSYKTEAGSPFNISSNLSKGIRKKNRQLSKELVSGIRDWNQKKNAKGEFRLKVVPVSDDNNNNTYSFVGDDNRWHTYALVRVYMSNGRETIGAGRSKTEKGNKIVYDVPQEGKIMALEIGLHSNEGASSPDLSVSAREDLGFYGYDATTKKVGKDLNSGFPYGTNILTH